MLKKHLNVNQMYINHSKELPFSKVTFYKYIHAGILNIRNNDLTRKVNSVSEKLSKKQ